MDCHICLAGGTELGIDGEPLAVVTISDEGAGVPQALGEPFGMVAILVFVAHEDIRHRRSPIRCRLWSPKAELSMTPTSLQQNARS